MDGSIIVHGGAGSWPATQQTDAPPGGDGEARRRSADAGCRAAARAGLDVLRQGGAALDAVEAAVRVLEADETFNAGYGAVLTSAGTVEHDAGIADGAMRFGGVGALVGHLHPVTIARRLLDRGPHVLLVGEGARGFAADEGFVEEPLDALISPRQRWRHEHADIGDTVGACAIDALGRVAAATSTGGIPGKRPGRMGDSAIAGAGLYAEDGLLAASATGQGDFILRVGLCRTLAESLRHGASLDDACAHALQVLSDRTGGTAGLIVVDARGRAVHHCTTRQMPWAAFVDGALTSGIEP